MAAQFLDEPSAAAARALLPPTVRAWLEAEQRHVTRQVDPRLLDAGSVESVPRELRPEGGRTWVLPTRWLPERDVRTWDAGLSTSLRRRFFRSTTEGREVLALLHPLADAGAAWLRRGKPGPRLVASATSSTRTVLVWSPGGEGAPFFAKLSLPRMVAGEPRGLSAAEIASSVGKTRLLTLWRGRRLGFLREPLGVAPREDSPSGFLVREIPREVLTGRCALVPFFALTELRAGFLRPFLDAFLECAVELGAVAEAHAQNLLVELGPRGGLTGRFWFRDLEGVSFDLAHLEQASARARKLVAELPVVRNRADDYDALDHRHAVQQSLHTFFVGGPLHRVARLTGRSWRKDFDHALHDAMRRIDDNAPPVRDGETLWRWLEGVRWRRRRPQRMPRSLRRWLHREQNVNDRVRHPRLFAPLDLRGLPEHLDPRASPVFELEAILVPADEVDVQPRELPPEMRRHLLVQRRGRSYVRFHIHPAAREEYALDVAQYGLERGVHVATPTASPRSLVVWSRTERLRPFGLKLSLDVEIQRISRLLRTSKLERARTVTRALDEIPASRLRAVGVSFLREPVTLRLRHRNHGTIVRELPASMDHLVPGFSLFAREGQERPLLRSMCRNEEEFAGFVVENVFRPVVRAAAFLAFPQGLLADLHQQNVLFETDRRGRLNGRIVVRDLDSVKVDVDARLRRGLSMRPWAQAHGTSEDLKFRDTARWYDDVFGKQVRAEWVFLGERLLGRRMPSLWRAMDRLIIDAAAEHLGLEVVVAELRYVLERGSARWIPELEQVASRQDLASLLTRMPANACLDRRELERPLYSVNAMVHAWRRQNRWEPRARPASRTELAALVKQGRSTVERVPRNAVSYHWHDDVLVASRGDGMPVAYALAAFSD
ncbi:MAG: IucA/IucC family protein [Myxococcota bacterium]